MNDDRWGEILDRILGNFEVIEHTKTKEDVADIETLIFVSPAGKIKLQRVVKPVILDKKVLGGKRRSVGSAHFEYTYSDTEKSHRMEAFREVDGEWQEIDADAFAK